MLTYTISVSIRSTLLRYSLFLSEYLSNHSNHSTTINTRPRRRPSVQLETDRPGIEANVFTALSSGVGLFLCSSKWGGAVLQHQKWGGALLQISALEQQFCVKPLQEEE